MEGSLEAFRLVIEHVQANNKQGLAVVNYSQEWKTPSYMLFQYIKQLIALDVVVVTASGNDRVSQTPSELHYKR